MAKKPTDKRPRKKRVRKRADKPHMRCALVRLPPKSPAMTDDSGGEVANTGNLLADDNLIRVDFAALRTPTLAPRPQPNVRARRTQRKHHTQRERDDSKPDNYIPPADDDFGDTDERDRLQSIPMEHREPYGKHFLLYDRAWGRHAYISRQGDKQRKDALSASQGNAPEIYRQHAALETVEVILPSDILRDLKRMMAKSDSPTSLATFAGAMLALAVTDMRGNERRVQSGYDDDTDD